MFWLPLLPSDVVHYVINNYLDRGSFFSLSLALGYIRKIKKKFFKEAFQRSLVSHGLSMTLYFLKWLNEEKICEFAAEAGSLDVIQFFNEEKKTSLNHGKLYRIAARHGHLPIIEYISSHFTRIIHHQYFYGREVPFYDPAIYVEAAKGNHLFLIEWAKENYIPFNKKRGTMAAAKNNGYLIKKSRSRNSCLTDIIGPLAASYGHLRVIDYLYKYEKKPNEGILYNAAKNGHLSIIQYYVENYPYESNNTVYQLTGGLAVMSGHLSIIVYLHEQEIYKPYYHLRLAMKRNHWPIVTYLLENGLYEEEELKNLSRYVEEIENIPMILYLKERKKYCT